MSKSDFPSWVKNTGSFFWDILQWRPYSKVHFSQEGEDVLLKRLFADQKAGFYIDIGAHHPFRFSNSYWAYRKGWTGINIDAAPDFENKFSKYRSRDINLHLAISDSNGFADIFIFEEGALNTQNPDRKAKLENLFDIQSMCLSVPCRTLSSVLDQYLPTHAPLIDFLTIDIEGNELVALKSNNWVKYKPRVIVLECLSVTLKESLETPEVTFLTELGYTSVAKLYNSMVLISDNDLLRQHWGYAK